MLQGGPSKVHNLIALERVAEGFCSFEACVPLLLYSCPEPWAACRDFAVESLALAAVAVAKSAQLFLDIAGDVYGGESAASVSPPWSSRPP